MNSDPAEQKIFTITIALRWATKIIRPNVTYRYAECYDATLQVTFDLLDIDCHQFII